MIALKIFLLAASTAWGLSPQSGAGTTGASFLKIGVGSRAMALSGACTAIADDPFALYWNPAGISRLSAGGQAAFFYDRWLGMAEHQFAAAAFRVEPWDSTAAVGFTRLGTKQRGYDSAGNATGEFNTTDLALSAGLAHAFEAFPGRMFVDERFLRVGVAAKLIRQSVPNASATGFALDAGLQAALREDEYGALGAGFSVLNFGPKMGMGAEADPLPLTYRFGTAYKHRASRFQLTADLEKARDNGLILRTGLEWTPVHALSFRAGYRTGKPEGGILDALSFGGCLQFKGLEIGGAFVGHADLGSSILLDLKVRWGRT